MESRRLLSGGGPGYVVGPGLAIVAGPHQDQGGTAATNLGSQQDQQGSNLHTASDPAGNSHDGGDSRGGGASQGAAQGGNAPQGGDSQGDPGPGPAQAGNPHSAADPTGNPHDDGDPTGNPHDGGDSQGGAGPGAAKGGSLQPGGDSQGGAAPGGNINSSGARYEGSDPGGSQGVLLTQGSTPVVTQHDGTASNDADPGVTSGQGGSSNQNETLAGNADHGVGPQADGATLTGPQASGVSQAASQSSGASVPAPQGAGANQPTPQGGSGNQAGPQGVGASQAAPGSGSVIQVGSPTANLSQGNAQALNLGRRGAQDGGPSPGPGQAISKDEGFVPLTSRYNGAQGTPPRRGGVEPPSLVGSDPSDLASPGISSPQNFNDVLAESLPIDLRALDRAIEQCLGRIDAMGDTLVELLGNEGAWPWVAGAVVVTVAGAAAHSWVRRYRVDPLALANGEGPISPWFLESISDG
jgi:hypothetical protein